MSPAGGTGASTPPQGPNQVRDAGLPQQRQKLVSLRRCLPGLLHPTPRQICLLHSLALGMSHLTLLTQEGEREISRRVDRKQKHQAILEEPISSENTMNTEKTSNKNKQRWKYGSLVHYLCRMTRIRITAINIIFVYLFKKAMIFHRSLTSRAVKGPQMEQAQSLDTDGEPD